MTTARKNNLANWIYKIFVASGLVVFCITTLISEGKRMEKVDQNDVNTRILFKKLELIEIKKADKEEVLTIREDLKYIRQRLDDLILFKSK